MFSTAAITANLFGDMESRAKIFYALWLSFSAGMGGMLSGYHAGLFFYSVPTWLQDIVSTISVVAELLGMGIGGALNDYIGRKKCILGADAIILVGSIMMATTTTSWVVVAGIGITSMGVGVASTIGPIYISEFAPRSRRGAFICVYVLLVNLGQFVAALMNMRSKVSKSTWILGFAAPLAALQFVFIWNLPESPRWVLNKGQISLAESILEKTCSSTEIEACKKESKSSTQAKNQASSKKDFFVNFKEAWKSKEFRYALSVALFLQVSQQFAGTNAVTYYSPTVTHFEGAADDMEVLLFNVCTRGIICVSTLICAFLVDKYGRRNCLIFSQLALIFCLMSYATFFINLGDDFALIYDFNLKMDTTTTKTLWLLVFFLAAYSLGIGTIPVILMSELFPFRYKGLGNGISNAAINTLSFVLGATFPSMAGSLGNGDIFLVFAGATCLSVIAILKVVPETRTLALEDVEKELEDEKGSEARISDEGIELPSFSNILDE